MADASRQPRSIASNVGVVSVDQLHLFLLDFDLEDFQCAVARLEVDVLEVFDPTLDLSELDSTPPDLLAILLRLKELKAWARQMRAHTAELVVSQPDVSG